MQASRLPLGYMNGFSKAAKPGVGYGRRVCRRKWLVLLFFATFFACDEGGCVDLASAILVGVHGQSM